MPSRSELFWLSLGLVGAVLLVFAARALFRPREPRRSRWTPLILGAALMLPAACAHRPAAPSEPHGAGWGDQAWTVFGAHI